MSEEQRFKLENELLMTKSKAQMINLYLDKLDQLQQKENIIKEVREYLKDLKYDTECCKVCDTMSNKVLDILNKGE